MNLFRVSVKLRLKITTFEEKNKNKIYWASIMVSMLIILLTYLSALIQWFPLFTTNNDKDKILNIWKTISKILGADFQSDTKEGFCNSDDMFLYVLLFFISSIDVYVMKLIRGLQVKLSKQLEYLESQNELEDEADDYSEDNLELRNLEKLKKLEGLGGLNYEEEYEGLLDHDEISSIESEAEDGKIISKADKIQNLKTLLMKNKEEEMDYDEAIRRSNMIANGRNFESIERELSESRELNPNIDPYDGEEEKEFLSPNKSKLDVLRKHARKLGQSPDNDRDGSSPDAKFKSSFMNNVDTGSPDSRRRTARNNRDTANVNLNLDLDSEDSEA